MRNTDADWETFAQHDPYWAVLTANEFRRDNLDEAAKAAFFANGEGTIVHTLHTLGEHFGCPQQSDVALDFGCGVGRLLFPLARRSRIAIGVDVSLSMLEECLKNAAEFGIQNVTLRQSDDALSQVQDYTEKVDFLTSLLVLQHIPPSRGARIFAGLLALLSPSCFGLIQLVTGPPPSDPSNDPEPIMEMNPYDLNAVVSIMQAKGIQDIFCRLTDHNSLVGVTLYFHRHRKHPGD